MLHCFDLFKKIKILSILSVFFVLNTQLLLGQIGYVDYRQLLLSHPLIRNFDFKTRRFLNTPSAWVFDKKKVLKKYNDKLAKLTLEAKTLDKLYRSVFKQKKSENKSNELFAIWHRKSEIKLLEFYLKKAKLACRTEEPYLYGAATGIETLSPIIQQISYDIKNSILALSRKYGNIPILDISSFSLTQGRQSYDFSLLYSNFHRSFWGKSNIKPEQLRLWLKSFRTFEINNYARGSFGPFVYGFKDLRQESIKNMSLLPKNQ